jgi:hypothetical protein
VTDGFSPLRLLEVLDRHEVAYVLIGGFAAVIHGAPLRTDDADICPAGDASNRRRLAAALEELDARIRLPDDPQGVAFPHDAEFLGRVGVWNLVTRFGPLDISFVPSGTGGYDDLRRDAEWYDLEDGLVVHVAALADVIRSKQAAGRDKDRAALPLLRRLLEQRSQDSPGPGPTEGNTRGRVPP